MENGKKTAYMELVESYCDTVYEEGTDISGLPDTFPWKKPVENMIGSLHYEHLKLPRYQGLLLFGDKGNGKHTFADAYIQSVCKSEMCFEKSVYIRLRAEDFNAKQLTSVEDIGCFVNSLFEICGMTGEHSFIVFDQMDSYSEITVVCNCIADEILSSSDKIHIICITDNIKKIPSELSKLLFRCSCANPDKNLRRKYLENNLSFNIEDWVYGSGNFRTIKLEIKDISMENLISMTEGFSFGMLNDFVQTLKMNVAGRTFGDEPVCTLSLSKEEVMQYIHMFSVDISSKQPEYKVMYMNAPAASTGTAVRSENDIEIKKLINKGEARTIEENLKLIEAVPVLNDSD